MFGTLIAEKALLIYLLSPLVQIGFSLATPDTPLVFGWTATMFCAYKALIDNKNHYYYLAGLFAGFALLSKYTAVLLLPGLLGFVIFSLHRVELRYKELSTAVGLALLLFMPVVVWNAEHNWSSFQFQLQHGLAGTKVLNLFTFSEFFGAQAAGVNPLFFLFLIYIVIRYFREILTDEKQAFLLWPCLTVLLFFAYAALFKRAEGNWAAPAYVTGIILLARWLDGDRYKKLYHAGIALGVVLILLLKLPEAFSFLPIKLVMKRQVLGYDAMFQSAGPYLVGADRVLAADYKLASLAWYYLPGQPTVQVLTPSRFSQYDYWRQDLPLQTGDNAVFFGYAEQKTALEQLFAEVIPMPSLIYSDRYIERSLLVFQCRGFQPKSGL